MAINVDVGYGLTDSVSQFASGMVGRPLPDDVKRNAMAAILDTIGVILAGVREPAPTLIRQHLGLSHRGTAAIIGTGLRASPLDAALANGVAAHALDFDDYNLEAQGHMSAVIVPAIMALGENLKAPGIRLIEAYVAGYEAIAAVGSNSGPRQYARGFHTTSTLGAIAASVACGVLLKLDTRQTSCSIGIAASLACGIRANFGTDVKPLHAGQAAVNGLRAALLAAGGFSASESVLDGADGFVEVFGGEVRAGKGADDVGKLGTDWCLQGKPPTLKKYPSCGMTHSAVEAAIQLRARYNLRWDDIQAVGVAAPSLAASVLKHHSPRSGLEAKFSMEYCVAAALLDGYLNMSSFSEAAVQRQNVRLLLEKVRTTHSRSYDQRVDRHEGMSGSVTVETGTATLELEVLDSPGSPANPLTEEHVLSKFKACAALVLSPAAAHDSALLLSVLDKQTDLTRLVELLTVQ